MSDLACWKLGDKFVLRVRGNEHLMDSTTMLELVRHIETVLISGEAESLGEDYVALCEANRRQKADQPTEIFMKLEAALGLISPPKPKLRRI